MGAWIETAFALDKLYRLSVASYVGAWIETQFNDITNVNIDVASYVGAWIETNSGFTYEFLGMSHPMWVRGLKQPL